MVIFLVQHGQCFDKGTDPKRSLSPEGRKKIIQVSDQASQAGITVTTIYHSDKLRSQQTAKLFSERLKANRIESITGINPLDDVEEFVQNFQFLNHSMIVGHLPFLECLTSYLITGCPEQMVVKFQNGGIVCLENNENAHWYIKWTIMPDID